MSQKRNLIFVQSSKMQLRSVRNQFSDLYLQNNSVNKLELAFEKGKPNPPKKQRLRIGGIGQNAITEYKFEMWRKLKSKALKWFRLAKIQLEWQRQQSSCTTRTTWAAPWKSPSIPTDILAGPLAGPYCGRASGYAVIWAPFTSPCPASVVGCTIFPLHAILMRFWIWFVTEK